MLLEKLVIPIGFDTGLLLQGVELIGDAIGGVISITDDWGGALDEVQDSLGGTSKEAAGLALAAKKIGMPVEQAIGLINKMTKGLQGANGELGPTGKLLESMGISALDSQGKIRPFSELIGEVSSKIAEMPDGLDKTNLELTLFGRAGAEAGDLMNVLANGGMQNVITQADKMGLAIDPAMVKSFDSSWATLQMTLQGFAIKVGSVLLPMLQGFLDKITDFAQKPEVAAFVDGALKKLNEFSGWITTVGIPKVEEFINTVNTKFAEFKDASKEETSAIKGHWSEMLNSLGILINDTFGVKGQKPLIDFQAVGVTALQAIDIGIFLLGQAFQALDDILKIVRKHWDDIMAAWDELHRIQTLIQEALILPFLLVEEIVGRILIAIGQIEQAMGLIGQGLAPPPSSQLPTTGGQLPTMGGTQTAAPVGFDYGLFAQILAAEVAKLAG